MCVSALLPWQVPAHDCAMARTATCSVEGCGREGRNGKAARGKYCNIHIPEGILAGSVTSHKRRATASPAPSSSSSQVGSALPEGWKLLEVKGIFGSRCAPRPCCRCLASPRLAKL